MLSLVIRCARYRLGNVAMLKSCFGAMSSLCRHPLNQSSVMKENGIDIVITVLKSEGYGDDTLTQYALDAAASFCHGNVENTEKFIQLNGLKPVLQLLGKHLTSMALVRSCCILLVVLRERSSGVSAMVQSDVVRLLLSASRRHLEIQELQHIVCALLGQLAREDSRVYLQVWNSEGFKILMPVISAFSKHQQILEACMLLLGGPDDLDFFEIQSKETCTDIGDWSMLITILNHSNLPFSIVHNAMKSLRNILQWENMVEKVVSLGVPKLLLKFIHVHDYSENHNMLSEIIRIFTTRPFNLINFATESIICYMLNENNMSWLVPFAGVLVKQGEVQLDITKLNFVLGAWSCTYNTESFDSLQVIDAILGIFSSEALHKVLFDNSNKQAIMEAEDFHLDATNRREMHIPQKHCLFLQALCGHLSLFILNLGQSDESMPIDLQQTADSNCRNVICKLFALIQGQRAQAENSKSYIPYLLASGLCRCVYAFIVKEPILARKVIEEHGYTAWVSELQAWSKESMLLNLDQYRTTEGMFIRVRASLVEIVTKLEQILKFKDIPDLKSPPEPHDLLSLFSSTKPLETENCSGYANKESELAKMYPDPMDVEMRDNFQRLLLDDSSFCETERGGNSEEASMQSSHREECPDWTKMTVKSFFETGVDSTNHLTESGVFGASRLLVHLPKEVFDLPSVAEPYSLGKTISSYAISLNISMRQKYDGYVVYNCECHDNDFQEAEKPLFNTDEQSHPARDKSTVYSSSLTPGHFLQFESRFEGGNLMQAIKVGKNEYDLMLRSDIHTYGHHQWFFFAVKNTHEKDQNGPVSYIFNIVNLSKPTSLYSHGMRPLHFSYDRARKENVGWRRAGRDIAYFQNPESHTSANYDRKKGGGPYFTLSFQMTFETPGDIHLFAPCYPYTYSCLQADLKRYTLNTDAENYIRTRLLCKSLSGLNCDLITITNFCEIEEIQLQKKIVVLTARVHPGETNASFMMDGTIRFLIGKSPLARVLRQKYIFKIVPMLNPDGVYLGNTRVSLAGVDLNRTWHNPSAQLHPTIWNVKEMIRDLVRTRNVVLFIDFHGHSRKKNLFMYGVEPRRSLKSGVRNLAREFMKLVAQSQFSSHIFSLIDCSFAIPKGHENSARVVVCKELGIRASFTLEASFSGGGYGLANSRLQDHHFSKETFAEIGRGLCDALLWMDAQEIRAQLSLCFHEAIAEDLDDFEYNKKFHVDDFENTKLTQSLQDVNDVRNVKCKSANNANPKADIQTTSPSIQVEEKCHTNMRSHKTIQGHKREEKTELSCQDKAPTTAAECQKNLISATSKQVLFDLDALKRGQTLYIENSSKIYVRRAKRGESYIYIDSKDLIQVPTISHPFTGKKVRPRKDNPWDSKKKKQREYISKACSLSHIQSLIPMEKSTDSNQGSFILRKATSKSHLSRMISRSSSEISLFKLNATDLPVLSSRLKG